VDRDFSVVFSSSELLASWKKVQVEIVLLLNRRRPYDFSSRYSTLASPSVRGVLRQSLCRDSTVNQLDGTEIADNTDRCLFLTQELQVLEANRILQL